MSAIRRAACLAALTALALGAATTVASADPLDGTGDAARNSDDQTETFRDAIKDSGAKNVILLIGDGMGDSEITVARNYAQGAAGSFAGIDALPITGQYTTYSLHNGGDYAGLPDYTPDSAATGTGWSTGTKSYDGAISVDLAGNELDSLLEIAKANGLRTGNVSTAAITDATPAVQVASISQRGCQGPSSTTSNCASEAVENGGPGSIAEQLIDSRPDVTLGGGQQYFDEQAAGGLWAGKTLWEQAEDRGYQVAKTADDLNAISNADSPVLGLFSSSHFPTRYATATATAGGGDEAAVTCSENPDRLSTDLSLGSLTKKAIDLLDSDQGFFLQVEGASIDKQDHAANACGQIGETVDLDEAVQQALEFAKNDGETLVIVTADHAHTSQIVDAAGPGLSIKLTTADGAPMIVAYGTAPAGSSQQHTGSQLRVAAYGPGGANVAGLTDQTDTFFTIAETLGLNRNLTALSEDAELAVPQEVAPDSEFQVVVTGLDGDKTARATLGDLDLGQADVINGTATFDVTAPSAEGTYQLKVVGNQTAVEFSADITVSASAPSPAPSPSPSASPSPTATEDSSNNLVIPGGTSNPNLPSTGGQVAAWLVLASALAFVGGTWAVRRARRSRTSH